MRIAVVPNIDKPDAMAASEQILSLLPGHTVVLLAEKDPRKALLGFSAELVIVLGGDGSILRIANAAAESHTAVVGINFGKLGHLTAFSLEEFKQFLPLILAGNAPCTDRMMLHAALYRNGSNRGKRDVAELIAGEVIYFGTALNDVVINAGAPFRMIELLLQIDRHETTTFRSDGLIVSTSSGSTGYNLSAGGPLMTPDVHAMALTPICPHSLSFRPVVLPDTAAVIIHPQRLNPGTRISFDGQFGFAFHDDQYLVVRRSPHPLRLVENPQMSHWQVLAQKLMWAHTPRHPTA